MVRLVMVVHADPVGRVVSVVQLVQPGCQCGPGCQSGLGCPGGPGGQGYPVGQGGHP